MKSVLISIQPYWIFLIIAKAMGEFANSLMEACPNKRVLHLAKYGKRRTKKKNINRIKRELRRG